MLLAFVLLVAQPAPTPVPASAPPPDIQLDIRASARRVVIENDGRADLQLRTAVNGRAGDGNVVDVSAPQVPQGRSELNDAEVRVRAEARIPDPLAPAPAQPAEQEQASPQ